MDPNAALEALRQLVKQVYSGARTDPWLFAEHFENLDEWLSKGGFLPEAWKKEEGK